MEYYNYDGHVWETCDFINFSQLILLVAKPETEGLTGMLLGDAVSLVAPLCEP